MKGRTFVDSFGRECVFVIDGHEDAVGLAVIVHGSYYRLNLNISQTQTTAIIAFSHQPKHPNTTLQLKRPLGNLFLQMKACINRDLVGNEVAYALLLLNHY